MSTHLNTRKLIERNGNVLGAVRLLVRYLAQRGGVDNSQLLTSAFTGGATAASFSNVTGLLIDSGMGFNNDFAVVGGRTYKFRLFAPMTTDGTAGAKLDFQGGSATFSSFAAVGYGYTAAAIATLAVTAVTSPVLNAATAYTSCIVEGTFTASGSGTFGPRLTVNTNGTAAQLLAGSYLSLTEVPISDVP